MGQVVDIFKFTPKEKKICKKVLCIYIMTHTHKKTLHKRLKKFNLCATLYFCLKDTLLICFIYLFLYYFISLTVLSSYSARDNDSHVCRF